MTTYSLVPYAYIDACGSKQHEDIFVAPPLTPTDIATIEACMESGEFFIPHDLGCDIPELQSRAEGFPSDSDHIWHTIYFHNIEVVNTLPQDAIVVPAQKLLDGFAACNGAWKDSAANSRLAASVTYGERERAR